METATSASSASSKCQNTSAQDTKIHDAKSQTALPAQPPTTSAGVSARPKASNSWVQAPKTWLGFGSPRASKSQPTNTGFGPQFRNTQTWQFAKSHSTNIGFGPQKSAIPSGSVDAMKSDESQFSQTNASPRPLRNPWDKSWANTGLTMGSKGFDVPTLPPPKHIMGMPEIINQYLFKKFNVKDDGNCLFRAISLGLFGTEDRHMEVRSSVVSWLRDHVDDDGLSPYLEALVDDMRLSLLIGEDHRRDEFRSLPHDEKTRFLYLLQILSESTKWGGDECLKAASSVYGIAIIVYEADPRCPQGGKVVENIDCHSPTHSLHLKFLNGNHYQLLIPPKNATVWKIPAPHVCQERNVYGGVVVEVNIGSDIETTKEDSDEGRKGSSQKRSAGRPRKRGKQSAESVIKSKLFAEGRKEDRAQVRSDFRVLTPSLNKIQDSRRSQAYRQRTKGRLAVPSDAVASVGTDAKHTLHPEEELTSELHALPTRRVPASTFQLFQHDEQKRRRIGVPKSVKKLESEVVSCEKIAKTRMKVWKIASMRLKAFQRQHIGQTALQREKALQLTVSAGFLRRVKQLKGKKGLKKQERRWKLRRRLWDMQQKVCRLWKLRCKAIVKLRSVSANLKVAMAKKKMVLVKQSLRQKRFELKHMQKVLCSDRKRKKRYRENLNKQKMSLLTMGLCSRVMEKRNAVMPRTVRYLRARKKFLGELAGVRRFRRLCALSGVPGMQQPGTRAQRIRREAEFKRELVDQLFLASRRRVTLCLPGESEQPREVQKAADEDLRKNICLAVESMLGVKKRALITFLQSYRKIRKTLSDWDDGKLTREELEALGTSGVQAIPWEDIIRPPEDAMHRAGQHEYGDEVLAAQEEPREESKAEEVTATDGNKGAGNVGKSKSKGTGILTPCDSSCKLPPRWGDRLVDLLRQLSPVGGVKGVTECFKDLMLFESCAGCEHYVFERMEVNAKLKRSDVDERLLCLLGREGCQDGVKLLLRLCYHSRALERLLNTVYQARRAMQAVIELESALVHGNFQTLCSVLDKVQDKNEPNAENRKKMRDAGPALSYERVVRQFGHLMDAFREVERDHPVQACDWCEQLKRRTQVKHFKSLEDVPNQKGSFSRNGVVTSLERQLGHQNPTKAELAKHFPMEVCETCYNLVRKGSVGAGMLENGMRLTPLPPELANINRYEEILISRLRPFYSVVRLRSYGNTPKHLQLQATKGNAVHLRIPITETMSHCLMTMPTRSPGEMLRLYADVKTTAGQVWRNLVDMDKIMRSLEWLKANNPHYADIVIDRDVADKVDPDTFVILTKEKKPKEDDQVPNNDKDGGSVVVVEDQGHHILTQERNHEIVAEFSMVPANTPQVKVGEDVEAYMQTAVSGEPRSVQEDSMDALTFPLLYPTGDGSLSSIRQQNLRLAEHARYQLMRKDKRFARNQTWMHTMHYHKMDRAIRQGMYASTKTGAGIAGLTAGELRRRIANKEQEVENSVTSLFQKIKGTKEYWYTQKGDLAVMDEELGPATWFVTLSCAEYHWEGLEEYLRERNSDLPGAAKMAFQELILKDPVGVSEFFMRRFKGFMKEVLLKPDGPLGEIVDYYWRLEYQARGAPHIHMKLWQKDAPVLGRPGMTEEIVLAHIAKYVTAMVPLDEDNRDLRTLVDSYQRHRCTGSCAKLKFSKAKEGKAAKYWHQCRYGFPQPVNVEYSMGSLEESVKATAKAKFQRRGKVKKWYQLPRGESERNVNPYNPTILQTWRANMDIQFVGEESRVLNSYITSYMTKGEKGEAADIFDAMEKDGSVHSRLLKLAYASLKNREVGPYEIADDLLGHHLHESSVSVEWVGVGMPHKRTRKMLKFTELENLPDKSTRVVAKNLVEDYYPGRNDQLEDISLYQLHSDYRHEAVKDDKAGDKKGKEGSGLVGRGRNQDRYMDRDKKGCFVKRTKRVLVKGPTVPCTRERAEEYFHNLLQLHVPYRVEEELLKGCETYREAFTQWLEQIPELAEAAEKKEKMRAAVELNAKLQAEALAQAEVEEEEERVAENEEEADHGEAAAIDPNGFRSMDGYGTAEGLASRVTQLNSMQRKVFEDIMGHIRHQLRHEKEECQCGTQPEPVRKFVSGGAGVGKSRLIQTLTEALELESPHRVHLSAPTGLAARNIDGETCHRLFNLPIQQDGVWKKRELGKEQKKEVFKRIGKTKLFIIDEISMVSNVMLEFIHQRLVSLKECDPRVAFGGYNMVVLGDLLQLPPVSEGTDAAPYCFTFMSDKQRQVAFPDAQGLAKALAEGQRQRNGSVPHLWSEFDYAELTENMRQQGDKEFADLLNQLRVGNVDNCMEKLKSRVVDAGSTLSDIAKLLSRLLKEGKKPVCLMPLVDDVLKVNVAMLLEDGVRVKFVHAVDQSRQRKKKKGKAVKKTTVATTGDAVTDMLAYINANTTLSERKTGGLREVLPIGAKARVMLTKNLDLSAGLFNGAMGTVDRLMLSGKEADYVAAVVVRFDADPDTEVVIERASVLYTPSPAIEVVREQFPLTLGYAVTIHKSQGLSLDCLVTDLGRAVFCPGMAYVALSRARTLEGLHMLCFTESSVWADPKAVAEYNRLRRVGRTGLPDLVLGRRAKSSLGPIIKRRMQNAVPDITLDDWPKKKKVKVSRNTDAQSDSKVTKTAVKASGAQNVGSYTGPLFLPLRNPGNLCFCNAAVQGLLNLNGVRAWAESEEGSELWRVLRPFVAAQMQGQHTVRNAAPIRDLVQVKAAADGFTDNFGDGGQKDSLEFLKYLLECSPTLKQKFTFRYREVAQCIACEGAVEVNLREPQDGVELTLDRPSGADESASWAEVLETAFGKQRMQKRCQFCQPGLETGDGTWHEKRLVVQFPQECEHLILRVNRLKQKMTPEGHVMLVGRFNEMGIEMAPGIAEEECLGKVTGFTASRVVVAGTQWKTEAAIVHEGASMHAGHYLAIVNHQMDERNSEGGMRWLWKSDTVSRPLTRFVSNMKGVYFLLLSRRQDA